VPSTAELEGALDLHLSTWMLGLKKQPAVLRRILMDARTNAAAPAFWNKLGSAASLKSKKKGDDLEAVMAAVVAALEGAEDLDTAIGAASKKFVKNEVARGIMTEFKTATVEYSELQGSPELEALKTRREELQKQKPKASDLDAFYALSGRKGTTLKEAYVADKDKAAFSKALMQLPAVQFFLDRREVRKKRKAKTARRVAVEQAQWQDGGLLRDSLTMEPDNWAPFRAKARFNSTALRTRLDKVDWMLKQAVAPSILATIPRPTFKIHTKGAQSPTNWHGQRASCGAGLIEIGYDQSTNVIMHEVGHHLENSMAPEVWLDIRAMVDVRHEAAGGGQARGGANVFTHWSEGGYGGTYATGTYTARAYKTGIGEVFSMAMQYFSKPDDTRTLIDGDPMHAAIVLRALNPDAYASVEELRPFDKYINPTAPAPAEEAAPDKSEAPVEV
jgi:hypothetical protein